MAYLSLYRKYRPQSFAEILGQEHVSKTLANAIVAYADEPEADFAAFLTANAIETVQEPFSAVQVEGATLVFAATPRWGGVKEVVLSGLCGGDTLIDLSCASTTGLYDFAARRWSDETPAGPLPVNRCLHGCWWSEGANLTPAEIVVADGVARVARRRETWEAAMEQRDRLMTPGEVASLFRVDPKTVTRWAKAGKLSSIRTLGGHRRYRESEVRELLSEYEFPGDDTPVIRVSALKALEGDAEWQDKIIELMDAVDNYIPLPERAIDKPFLMPVEDIFSISGRGTVVTGRIERGKVKVGDTIEIVDALDLKPGDPRALLVVPVALLLAYGALRVSVTLFTELREAGASVETLEPNPAYTASAALYEVERRFGEAPTSQSGCSGSPRRSSAT